MVSCLLVNVVSSIEWYVVSETLFNRLREQEEGLIMILSYISFLMPSCNILKFNDVIFVYDLKNNIISI